MWTPAESWGSDAPLWRLPLLPHTGGPLAPPEIVLRGGVAQAQAQDLQTPPLYRVIYLGPQQVKTKARFCLH